jgi:cyclic beta-1,2-glucan synthetase
MFEYLMPSLFMPAYPGSLLWESARFCVRRQREDRDRGVWGRSESALDRMDAAFHYCYQAHGTQALALKQGMDRERVTAPYAAFLALPWGVRAAVKDLRRFQCLGAEGSFGFYEAVDFTPGRSGGEGYGVVRCFMAHHLGMSLLAVLNALQGNILHRRFLLDPEMAAFTALLQERGPAGERIRTSPEYRENERPARRSAPGRSVSRSGYSLEEPACFPLTNGRYTVLFSELGCSSSMAGSRLLAASSFRRFSPRQGILFFADGGRFLSLQPAPEYAPETEYRCEYDGARFVQHARDDGLDFRIETRLGRFACGEERRLRVRNRSRERRTVILGCWFEPALCTPESYAAHPAFSRLSLECRLREDRLILRRRPGGREGEAYCAVSCSLPFEAETDRDALGRGGLQGLPAALRRRGSHIADSENPCVLLRVRVTLQPGESREARFAFALGDTEERALRALGELRRPGGNPLSRAAGALGMEAGEAERALSLLTPLLYPTARETRRREESAAWDRGPDGLWQYGISGDLPTAAPGPEEAKRMLRSWALLRSMGAVFDLVLPVRDEGVYGRPECAALRSLAAKLGAAGAEGKRGGFHFAGGAPERQKALLARVTAVGIPGFAPPKPSLCRRRLFLPPQAETRELRRGCRDGESYTFSTEKGVGLRTWSHVLATGRMGFLAADTGGAGLYLSNAGEEPILPWENDPLALAGPLRLELLRGGETRSLFADADGCPTLVSFGFGWARWRRRVWETETEVLAFLPLEARGLALRVRLRGSREGDRLRFCAALAENAAGRPGLYCRQKPLAAWEDLLAAETGGEYSGGEGCVGAEYAAGEGLTLVFGLPEAADLAQPGMAERALERVREHWRALTGSVSLSSPSPALDAYLNGWALYQTAACRLLGRSSLYQRGGAFGFRDQLQDVCALCPFSPETAKAQILAAAAHQYLEGDVMHWWHVLPAGDRGVRTRCSDDLLWLPYAVCVYAETTGDRSLLETQAPWLVSPELEEGEEDRYEAPAAAGADSLLEHCRRAVRLVLRRGTGAHGLLRMGSGDWNDGFDRVRGESVWLSWFAALVLERFGVLTGDEAMRLEARRLAEGAENAWAGDRYLRGWYADGTPLGRPGDGECAVDSLAQSFAVLSGFGDPERSRTAVRRAAELLLDGEHGLVKLFAPPFDGLRDPGYIRSYLPGTRENGGQYTHAAVWLAAACLRCGETDLGWKLLETLLPGEKPEESYQAEPYVLAADVYANGDMPGRAGWTWYTGAAGWFLRTALEELLGLRFRDGALQMGPRLPAGWRGYAAELRAMGRTWRAEVPPGPEDPDAGKKPGPEALPEGESMI